MKRVWHLAVVVFLLVMQAGPTFACLLPGGMASSDCCCPELTPSACEQCASSPCEGVSESQARCCVPLTASTFALSRLMTSGVSALDVLDIDHSFVAVIPPVPHPPLALESENPLTPGSFDEPKPPNARPPYLLFERLTL